MQGSILILLILIISTFSVECISPSSAHRDKLEGGGDEVAGSSHHTDSSIVASRHNYVRVGEEVNSMVNNPRVLGLGSGKAKPENPSKAPTTPSPSSNPACVTFKTYDAIDKDIEKISKGITDARSRGRFLGGIVRLVAHDFMDYDRNNSTHPFGPDGCFNATHRANVGITELIWCSTCELTLLYEHKYSHMSKADFWVASANAVIRQTSVDKALDLRSTFKWGRKDAASCPGSGSRIPNATSCASVEGVFLTRMGLTWKDATVLIGAHALGRGNREFSGHDGTWKDTEEAALEFDMKFYAEMLSNSWEPRNSGLRNEDWTVVTDPNTRLMLNTDVCLVYDIDNKIPCCTGDSCVNASAVATKCPVLSSSHARYEAYQTVQQMLGGNEPNTNTNAPFYSEFTVSWNKATTIGLSNLSFLKDTC